MTEVPRPKARKAPGRRGELQMNSFRQHRFSQSRNSSRSGSSAGSHDSSDNDQHDSDGQAARPMSRQKTVMTALGLEHGHLFGEQVRDIGAEGRAARRARPTTFPDPSSSEVDQDELLEGNAKEVTDFLRRKKPKKRKREDHAYDQDATLRANVNKVRKDLRDDQENVRKKKHKPAPQAAAPDAADGDDESGSGHESGSDGEEVGRQVVAKSKRKSVPRAMARTNVENLTDALVSVCELRSMFVNFFDAKNNRYVVAVPLGAPLNDVRHASTTMPLPHHTLVNRNPNNIFGSTFHGLSLDAKISMKNVSLLFGAINPATAMELAQSANDDGRLKFPSPTSTIPKRISSKLELTGVVFFAKKHPGEQETATKILALLDDKDFIKVFKRQHGIFCDLQEEAKKFEQLAPDEEVASATFTDQMRTHATLGRSKLSRATRNKKLEADMVLGLISNAQKAQLDEAELKEFCDEFSAYVFEKYHGGGHHIDDIDQDADQLLVWKDLLIQDKVLSVRLFDKLRANVTRASAYITSFTQDADVRKARTAAGLRQDENAKDLFEYIPEEWENLSEINATTLQLNSLISKDDSKFNPRFFIQATEDAFEGRREVEWSDPKHGNWVRNIMRVMSEKPGSTKETILFTIHQAAVDAEREVPPGYSKMCSDIYDRIMTILDELIEQFVNDGDFEDHNELFPSEFLQMIILESIETWFTKKRYRDFDANTLVIEKLGFELDSDAFPVFLDKNKKHEVLLLFQCIAENKLVTERSRFIRNMYVDVFMDAHEDLERTFTQQGFNLGTNTTPSIAAYSLLFFLFKQCQNRNMRDVTDLEKKDATQFKKVLRFPVIDLCGIPDASDSSDSSEDSAPAPAPAPAKPAAKVAAAKATAAKAPAAKAPAVKAAATKAPAAKAPAVKAAATKAPVVDDSTSGSSDQDSDSSDSSTAKAPVKAPAKALASAGGAPGKGKPNARPSAVAAAPAPPDVPAPAAAAPEPNADGAAPAQEFRLMGNSKSRKFNREELRVVVDMLVPMTWDLALQYLAVGVDLKAEFQKQIKEWSVSHFASQSSASTRLEKNQPLPDSLYVLAPYMNIRCMHIHPHTLEPARIRSILVESSKAKDKQEELINFCMQMIKAFVDSKKLPAAAIFRNEELRKLWPPK